MLKPSVSWKRLKRARFVMDCPTERPIWTLIVGAPIPRHPEQSCCCAGSVLALRKKYEKRKSLTSVERNTLVNPRRLWSAQFKSLAQLEGTAVACVLPGANER